jgi:hypothetical protein
MPGMRCPSCGASVDERAERCPACGEDLPVLVDVHGQAPGAPESPGGRRGLPRGAVLAAVVLALGLFWLAGRGSDAGHQGLPSGPSTAGASASSSPLGTGRAPSQAGGIFICGFGYQYAAFASPRRVYPPNHPLRPPPSEEPVRCYPSLADAGIEGYPLAPPPPGDVLLEGVYLEPVDLSGQCLEAARRLDFAVPCPGLLPNPGPGVALPRCGGIIEFSGQQGCTIDGGFLMDYAGFAAPPGFGRPGSGTAPRAVLVAVDTRGAANQEVSFFMLCRDARAIGTITVLGPDGEHAVTARVQECPVEYPPPMAGLTILMWTQGGITYEVAAPAALPLAQGIASSVRLVGPGG